MAGGLGPKRVDVTWATEESGLLLAISVKSINFMDRKSKAYQKNLTNRRGDMLFESVTLHRRFPYAVLAGFLILDKGATEDDTSQRKSTFENAHARLELFTGRDDPAGRDEQYERLFVCVFDPNQFAPGFETTPLACRLRPSSSKSSSMNSSGCSPSATTTSTKSLTASSSRGADAPCGWTWALADFEEAPQVLVNPSLPFRLDEGGEGTDG